MEELKKVTINNIELEGTSSVDILSIALSHRMTFPHSCRIGSCGTCKCKLVSGSVRQLTESAYLLSEQEIKSGFILACQSIPLTDVTLEVPKFSARAAIKGMTSENEIKNKYLQAYIEKKPASLFQYLKFMILHLVGLFSLACILAGGKFISWGLLLFHIFYLFGEALLGDDTSVPNYQKPNILTFQLWLALPLLSLIVFSGIWSVSTIDFLGFGQWMHSTIGFDLLGVRAKTAWYHHLSAGIFTALMVGVLGTITAHELTHRTWDKVSLNIGRWLLAFSFDTTFAIEHVYGHHRYVATTEDPATAPRGRNVYHHIWDSTVRGNLSAWKIETERLRTKGMSLISMHNSVLRGHLMSLTLIILACLIGGLLGGLFFILVGLGAKALLETVNYMEHYGMIRDPNEPVQTRHSWNTNNRISSWTLVNLTRHSDHHARGEIPFQQLQPCPEAPLMIGGYLTTVFIALIPPLWNRFMSPKLVDWDQRHASPREIGILRSLTVSRAKCESQKFYYRSSGWKKSTDRS